MKISSISLRLIAALAVSGVLVGGAAYAAGTPAITPAPAFTTADLAKQPQTNWITNGGSLSNQRYSPLTEISTANVARLKGVWMTHLPGAQGPKYSAEGQPLVYDGVVYVPNGEDDVFAISATSGKTLWTHLAHLDQTISTVCCGWESRGVALGDGRVYIGQLDGKLVALDQSTGKPVWSTQLEKWQDGYSITDAPLYVDGLVITGLSGGEYKIRGRVTAFDARTGKEVWRFYTIPGPGQPGHETWPKTGSAWQHGGAPVWQTPSVDPQTGMMYFSTGNASPDSDGTGRAGNDQHASSIVALDVRTGKYRWSYQFVHHDIWDYDAPSPTVLFDATIHGRTVHGIGEAAKTGWLYLLDRTTGKPIFPIPERPVPQNAAQHTSPTQPIPSYPNLVPTVPTAAQIAEIRKAAGPKVTITAQKQIFTPYYKNEEIVMPGPTGGTNWPPSSYSPRTHMFYVCSQAGIGALDADAQAQPARKPGAPISETIGSVWTIGHGFHNPGIFSAVDATTGHIVWQKHFKDSCYSGSSVTAGNVVFVGQNDGELQGYDAAKGTLLWHFQTGAGANSVATIFERSNGHESLLMYSGGNALGTTPHGNNLWLLGLDGKLGPAAAPGAGTGVQHAGAGPIAASAVAVKPASAANGAAVFSANCAVCHGATGLGGNGGPNLMSIAAAKNLKSVMTQVTNGGGGMPAFKGTLSQQQIDDVSAFVVKNITHGAP